MYEKVLATICTAVVTFGVLWFVCRRDSKRQSGSGTGTNNRQLGDDIKRAADDNSGLKDAEQRTRETIERAEATRRRTDELIGRAGENTERGQELVQKAKSILNNARHTD